LSQLNNYKNNDPIDVELSKNEKNQKKENIHSENSSNTMNMNSGNIKLNWKKDHEKNKEYIDNFKKTKEFNSNKDTHAESQKDLSIDSIKQH